MSTEVPATVLADETWLRADLGRAANLYGRAEPKVLGTIRWYSASSVLVAPALEPFLHSGIVLDPSLESVLLTMHPDGRYLDARATRTLGDSGLSALGTALGEALEPAVTAAASVCGATPRSLWAIALDSVANRLLWAGSALGSTESAMELAAPLAEAIGHGVPLPRFTMAGGNADRPVVRRASCCLIYHAGSEKCTSCPRQTPAERQRRLRALLG
ncbi:Fe-S oxidoreductase [Prauserella marina]|uniref:FhuF 2Fe-2S C-terminal domain-containing protein n=1 Tax=Prauserella marina TaxID=530584 RepID=A0A222VLI8_9PSEU|nr:(2Fe-2S)-binding protein [Prauserella marina]ASR34747.1 Fe-S oxidoreductase [Prauserella marina]PWV85581.1 FhuF-like iron-sulfur protein [Prauserella marina]SDC51338.1 FhuF 2Fe-2S C-terminal domain-containing protein [Prauserella marina]